MNQFNMRYPGIETNTFAPLPHWLLRRTEISLAAKLIYARLVQFIENGVTSPSRETLSKKIGSCTRTVDRFISELKEFNLIQVRRNGNNKPNTYELLPHVWMKEDKSNDL